MASFKDLLISGLKQTVGHFVTIAVGLGQIHQINFILFVAIPLFGKETLQSLEKNRGKLLIKDL
jgi:hypothetical protein